MRKCTSKAHPGGKGDRYAGTVEIIRLSPSALSAPQYSGALSPLRATRVYLLTRTLCEIAPLIVWKSGLHHDTLTCRCRTDDDKSGWLMNQETQAVATCLVLESCRINAKLPCSMQVAAHTQLLVKTVRS